MNKFLSLFTIFLFLLFAGCTKSDNEYIGTFQSTFPMMMKKSGSYSLDKMKKANTLMDLTLIVTADYLKIKMGNKDYLQMKYFKDGNCIIGEYIWGKETIYYPIYFSDKDNAFSWGQQFIRKN